ncbi:MAG: MotA/TolQ/ExbB proton channel family protein [Candidatus Pacebacteria bacterium]|nr:MotA/TolQ/ExbB proton channel family protein [Candidatus Paceibacterota bacterium]
MMKKRCWILVALMFTGLLLAGNVTFAQGEEGAAGPETEQVQETAGFVEIVFGGGPVNTLIWLMIFATSAATLALIIDALITVKRDKLIPEELVEGVRESLNQGDLDAAVEACEANPCPLSTILMVGFSNITEGYEVIQEAIASAAEIENEKLMQRVNYLNLCGQISPMLGLLGTVVGMVRAFAGLAGASGAAKATILASAISTALWTTAVGLIIAVPALLSYTLIRNYATRLVLEVEASVVDLIKILRNAEVEEE